MKHTGNKTKWSRFVKGFALGLAVLLYLPSCASPEPGGFPVRVLSLSDSDSPISGVTVRIDGIVVGVTDRDGALSVEVRGVEGDAVALSAECPSGFRQREQKRRLVLRHLDRLDEGGNGRGAELIWRCIPVQRLAALVVRADGQADLPVLVAGRELGRTGAQGTAHALLQFDPGTSLQVTLDTSHRPDLRPRSPRRAFRLEDRDTLLILDQTFSEKRRRRWRKKGRATPKAPVPYRIR